MQKILKPCILVSVHILCTAAWCGRLFLNAMCVCNVHYARAKHYVVQGRARVTRCPHFPEIPTKNRRLQTAAASEPRSSKLLSGSALIMRAACVGIRLIPQPTCCQMGTLSSGSAHYTTWMYVNAGKYLVFVSFSFLINFFMLTHF